MGRAEKSARADWHYPDSGDEPIESIDEPIVAGWAIGEWTSRVRCLSALSLSLSNGNILGKQSQAYRKYLQFLKHKANIKIKKPRN